MLILIVLLRNTYPQFKFFKRDILFVTLFTTISLATLRDSKHGVAKNLRAQGGKSNTSKKKTETKRATNENKNGGQPLGPMS